MPPPKATRLDGRDGTLYIIHLNETYVGRVYLWEWHVTLEDGKQVDVGSTSWRWTAIYAARRAAQKHYDGKGSSVARATRISYWAQ